MTTRCGNRRHAGDCLCDVVITEITPVNYHFDQVWHAGIIARALGWKQGQGGAKLASYLEALGEAYDATRNVATSMEGILSTDLKVRVEAHLQDNQSILDLPDIVGEPFDRVVAALTGCQPCIIWTWEEKQWLEFEAYLVQSPTHSQRKMAATFGLTRSQCTTLIRAYGRGFESDVTSSRVARAWELFAEQPEASTVELKDMLAAEGHTYTYDGVRVARQRWKRKRAALAA